MSVLVEGTLVLFPNEPGGGENPSGLWAPIAEQSESS